jgi:hypothetical protein
MVCTASPKRSADGERYGRLFFTLRSDVSLENGVEGNIGFSNLLGYLKRASDDEIRKLIAYLKANGIALAVETPVLADTA